LDYAHPHITDWLPTTRKETLQRGWDKLDVVLFSGDAYVDHPAFGAAVIGRVLEDEGLRVSIVPQPNWRDDLRDFKKFGRPELFFAVTAGNMDSMVNHYTANKRLRSDDAFTPGGQSGFRPDYASVVYSKILKSLFPDVPVILGGIEASLRRLVHYDYWSDQLKPGILFDSQADLLVYGMGEKQIRQVVSLLRKGVPFSSLKNIPQTAYMLEQAEKLPRAENWEDMELASFEMCVKDRKKHAVNFKRIELESNRLEPDCRLIQKSKGRTTIVNPAYPVMTAAEIDASFDLPYTRLPHPKYNKRGRIPAYEMIRHSVNIHRGCFGGCSFCSISAHQGKFIVSRSQKSILNEIKQLTRMPDFKGYLSDLGGPSANMYGMQGEDLDQCKKCSRPSCIFPGVCSNLDMDHSPLNALYKKARAVQGVKKATIGSGVRYDLFLGKAHGNDPDKKVYFTNLVRHHISGRLKVAPEHTEDSVLKLMRKPGFDLFVELKKGFDAINKEYHLRQQLVPYFISSHPGCHDRDMARLAEKTIQMDLKLEQVQDFTPTPMTLATVVYYSGFHPVTLESVYTAKTKEKKLKQRSYFFSRN